MVWWILPKIINLTGTMGPSTKHFFGIVLVIKTYLWVQNSKFAFVFKGS